MLLPSSLREAAQNTQTIKGGYCLPCFMRVHIHMSYQFYLLIADSLSLSFLRKQESKTLRQYHLPSHRQFLTGIGITLELFHLAYPAFLTASSFHHPASKARSIGIDAGETCVIGFACSSGFGWGVMKKTVCVLRKESQGQSTPPLIMRSVRLWW